MLAGDAFRPGAWVLVEPVQAVGGLTGDVQGCHWPACPARCAGFGPTQLLQHYRSAHGGDIPDDLLAWAGGVRCGDCGLPYPRTHLLSHHRVDPSDGERRCPSRIRPATLTMTLSPADAAFVNDLPADEIYITTTPTMEDVPYDVRGDYAALVGGLMDRCVAARKLLSI